MIFSFRFEDLVIGLKDQRFIGPPVIKDAGTAGTTTDCRLHIRALSEFRRSSVISISSCRVVSTAVSPSSRLAIPASPAFGREV
jgi:hypothetical protein